MKPLRIALWTVGAAAAAGVIAVGGLGLAKFTEQQRSQSAYLLSISTRLIDLANAVSRIESGLAAARVDLDRLHKEQIAEFDRRHDQQMAALKEQRRLINLGCQAISSLPAKIERPGRYCLRDGIQYSLLRDQDAIVVAADDVTIDLQGGTLLGPNAGDTLSAGIYSKGYRNLAVSRGTISGFMWGIRYDEPPPERKGGGTLVFQDLIIRDSGFRGVYVDFGNASAQGSVNVTDSIIERVGGTRLIRNAFAIGVELKYVKSCRISGNRVVDVLPLDLGEGVGISLTRGNGGCVVEQNYFLNGTRPEWGRTIGVWPGDLAHNPSFIFRNNVVYNYNFAFMHNSDVSVFSDNLFHSIACAPRSMPYYQPFTSLNRWINEGEVCTDHPSNFRAAADAGDVRAQFRMGIAYWEGITAKGSVDQAWQWFELAAKNGSDAAKDWIASQHEARKRDPSWYLPQSQRE